VADAAFGCAAILFVVVVAAGALGGVPIAKAVWQDRQERHHAFSEARAQCAGRFDPEESGSPEQQYDSCVYDATDTYIGVPLVHPALMILGGLYGLCLLVSGVAFLSPRGHLRQRVLLRRA
jgi:hypothetical protein